MMKRRLFLGGVLALLSLPAAAAACDDPRPLRFALIPKKNVDVLIDEYRPLVARLGQALGRRIEIVRAPSYSAVIEGLVAGTIDLAELGPASYALARSRGAGLVPFASFRQRVGPTTESSGFYRSLLISRRGSGLDTLARLRGRTLSLIDPASTSGAVLPRRAIERQTGMSLESYFQRVTFAGSHDRAIEIVRDGLVDAAFVASTRVDEAIRRGGLRLDEIDIVWRSAPVPYDPFVYRERLCPATAAKIREVFLGDAAMLRAMFAALDVTGFAAVGDDDYREIHALFAPPP